VYVAHAVYNEHMAEIKVKGWLCDVCGYIWLRTEVIPTHCPNRDCRSRRWNAARTENERHPSEKSVRGVEERKLGMPLAAEDGIIHEPEFCQDPSCRECRKLRTAQ
jgi:hypothetical protein